MTKIPPPFPLLSKDKGLRDIGHIMSIRNLSLGVNAVVVSYLILYDSLLQNATNITTKCDSKFITKCERRLLQNASGLLLQNATILLKNAIVITNCDNFFTKSDNYYKMRGLLQIAMVHRVIQFNQESLLKP